MRTAQQKVIFQLNRLNIAIAATARAERKVTEAHEKKASALTYAESNIGHAEREIATVTAKLETARKALIISEEREPAEYVARIKAARSNLSDCENTVTLRIARLADLKAAVIAAEADIVAASSSVLVAQGNLKLAEDSPKEKSPGSLYARTMVENFERHIAAATMKLTNAQAELVATGSRYTSLIESAVAVRNSFQSRQADVQFEYNEATNLVETEERAEHARFMAQQKEEQAEYAAERREHLRKIKENTNTVTQTDSNHNDE